jgi:hypothetical protein
MKVAGLTGNRAKPKNDDDGALYESRSVVLLVRELTRI